MPCCAVGPILEYIAVEARPLCGPQLDARMPSGDQFNSGRCILKWVFSYVP